MMPQLPLVNSTRKLVSSRWRSEYPVKLLTFNCFFYIVIIFSFYVFTHLHNLFAIFIIIKYIFYCNFKKLFVLINYVLMISH